MHGSSRRRSAGDYSHGSRGPLQRVVRIPQFRIGGLSVSAESASVTASLLGMQSAAAIQAGVHAGMIKIQNVVQTKLTQTHADRQMATENRIRM